MSCPFPRPTKAERGGGARLDWDSLLAFSDIGGLKSYNYFKISDTKIQNKTTTIVVFSVSIHSPKSHLLIHIQKLYIYIYIFRAHNLHVVNPYKCADPAVYEKSRKSSSVPTRIKTRAKLYA